MYQVAILLDVKGTENFLAVDFVQDDTVFHCAHRSQFADFVDRLSCNG